MENIKLVAKFSLIWGVVFGFFISLAVYQDFKQNKLFNYTETYSPSQVEVSPSVESSSAVKYIFKMSAHDDYLGSISFNYFHLKDIPGQVVFRIKQISQDHWYAENRYDFSYFNNEDNYHFGFPEIADSKNKQFELEFEIVTPNLAQRPEFVDLKTVPLLTAKYVFPHNTYYQHPSRLVTILLNRTRFVITGIDYSKIGIVSFVISLLSFLAIYRRETGVKSQIEIQQKAIRNNLLGINPFFIPIIILVILASSLFLGNFLLAQHMSEYLWISLFGSVLIYFLQCTVLNRLTRIIKIVGLASINMVSVLDELMTKQVFKYFGVLLIIISGLSTTYYLGGDDSRIFYLYPQEFLRNYASKIVSDTGLSQLTNSIPPSSLSAFMVLLIGLKNILPGVNLQALLYTGNLVGGFFAFYLLISYLLHASGKHERVICILASLMYVFSIFNFYTLLNSRLMAEYLISLYPLTVYMGIKSVREGKLFLLVAVVMIWSAFNFVSVTIPLSAAALITTVPLLVFATWKNKLRLILYSIVAVLVFVILNLHWLTFIPYTNFSQTLPGSSTLSVASMEFRQLNEAGIKQVSEINNSFFPLLNSFHRQIQLDFHWPQLPIYLSWYSNILVLGYLLIAVVMVAGLVIEKDKPRIGLYIACVINFVLAIYFFTINIGPWGEGIFLWLSDYIPAFVIFRNMYDKFAYSLAFQWAVIIAVSLAIVVKSMKSNQKIAYLLFSIFLIAILNAKPFVLGEFEKLPYWTTKHSYDGIKGFNKDYQDLLDFVKKDNSVGRYLSLPLLTGNSVIVQGFFGKDHYYAGVSPLLLLTDKNDLSGLISFGNKASLVFQWLEKRDYVAFGKLLQQYNVKYVIVNNLIPDDLQGSFMFSDGLFALQTKEFVKSLTGQKIKDFGSRYSLYEINPKYRSEKLYLSDAELTFEKIASYEYHINIPALKGPQTLVFLDPYLPKWQLLSDSGRHLSENSHGLALDYANSWKIDPEEVKSQLPVSDYQVNPDGSLQLKLRLYFQPHDYFTPVNTISAAAYILGACFVLLSVRHSRQR